jgi:hypothetical protein
LTKTYRLPDWARSNTPQRISDEIRRTRAQGHVPELPFGSDLTETELGLARALPRLKRWKKPELAAVKMALKPPSARALPYLERMQLAHPSTLEEQLMQRAVLYALAAAHVL